MGSRLALVWMVVALGLLGCDPRPLEPPDTPTTTPQTTTTTTTTDVPDASAPDADARVSPPAPASTHARSELMKRWNLVVNGAGASIDFHWSQWDQFPHPTYRGGTSDAYHQFAAVLLSFLQDQGNFAFLLQNQLFRTSLDYIFPSGQNGLGTTFERLASDFSSDSMASFAMLSADAQQAMAAVYQNIELALGR